MASGEKVGRRRVLGAAVGAAVAAALGGCRHGSASAGPPSAAPTEAVGALPAVAEALWVADGYGVVRAYDGRTYRVTARVDTQASGPAQAPPELAVDGGVLWAYGDGRVAAVDPGGARVLTRASVPAASPPAAVRVVAALGALWVAHPGGLWRVSVSGQVTEIVLPQRMRPGLVVAFDGRLWVVDRDSRRVAAVTATGTTATAAGSAPVDAAGVTAGPAGLFFLPGNSSRTWLWNPDTAATGTVSLPGKELIVTVLAAGADMWMIGNLGTVARVGGGAAPAVSKTVRVSDTSQDFPAAVGLGSLWVCDEEWSQLLRVDPVAGRVHARLDVPAADPDDPAFAVVTGAHSIWLLDTNLADGVLAVDPTRGRVARLEASRGVSTGVTAAVAAPPSTTR